MVVSGNEGGDITQIRWNVTLPVVGKEADPGDESDIAFERQIGERVHANCRLSAHPSLYVHLSFLLTAPGYHCAVALERHTVEGARADGDYTVQPRRDITLAVVKKSCAAAPGDHRAVAFERQTMKAAP